jgi:hypothetical protein
MSGCFVLVVGWLRWLRDRCCTAVVETGCVHLLNSGSTARLPHAYVRKAPSHSAALNFWVSLKGSLISVQCCTRRTVVAGMMSPVL